MAPKVMIEMRHTGVIVPSSSLPLSNQFRHSVPAALSGCFSPSLREYGTVEEQQRDGHARTYLCSSLSIVLDPPGSGKVPPSDSTIIMLLLLEAFFFKMRGVRIRFDAYPTS